jgi:hypothetical protein
MCEIIVYIFIQILSKHHTRNKKLVSSYLILKLEPLEVPRQYHVRRYASHSVVLLHCAQRSDWRTITQRSDWTTITFLIVVSVQQLSVCHRSFVSALSVTPCLLFVYVFSVPIVSKNCNAFKVVLKVFFIVWFLSLFVKISCTWNFANCLLIVALDLFVFV